MKLLAYTLCVFVTTLTFAAKDPVYLKVAKVKQAAMIIGKSSEAVITAAVEDGFHVQSNPASQPNLVATSLTLEPAAGLQIGEIKYPEGKTYRLQNSDRDLRTYDGNFEVKVPVKALDNAKVGKAEIKGKLRFQACNDKICFFPSSVPVTIPVVVYK